MESNIKMKVALTYAPSEQQFLPVPPLGVSVLSQHLKNSNIDNDIIDLELELWISLGYKSSEYALRPIEKIESKELPVDSVVALLMKYDIVGFSVMGKRQIPYVAAIVDKLRKKSSVLRYIILGGAFFSERNAKELMLAQKGMYDFVIVGEGWRALPDLISCLKTFNIKNVCHIPGVVSFDRSGDIIYQASEKWEGELPNPNYKEINKEGYLLQQKHLYGINDSSIIYHVLVGDRHCPYKCSFCRISDNTKVVKQPTEIADEMIELNRMVNADCFSLICNEMNPTEKFFHDFLDRLLSYEKKLKWFCYLRPNNLSLETLKKARKAGCILIRYGVETGSQRILDMMNKKLYVDEMKCIMNNTNKAGIWNHINIVTGYLYETQSDIDLTLSFIDENKMYIDSVRVNPFFVPIGSPIHMNPEKFGIKIRKNLGSYVQFDEQECMWEEKQILIQQATQQILTRCVENNINFAGILPFLVAKLVAYFGDVKSAKKWIEDKHEYLRQPISPDTAKWRLAHPERTDIAINKWEEIAGKRGANYQTLMEVNCDEEDSY